MTSLSLSNGESAEYGTVLVSMPHTISFRIPELPKAQALAERLGWQFAELAEEVLRTWSTSFKRRLIESKSRLLKGVNNDRRHVIEDAIACEHLPLDVQSWGVLRERYFKKFATSMYHFEEAPMARAFKKGLRKVAERNGNGGDDCRLSPSQK